MVLVEAGTPWHGIRTIQLAKTDIFFCISALPFSCHIVIGDHILASRSFSFMGGCGTQQISLNIIMSYNT